MAIADITKPMALDETLQATNTALGNVNTNVGAISTAVGGVAKDTTLQTTNSKMDTQAGKLDDIKTAILGIGMAAVGNTAALTTTDKTSLVAAVNELNGGKVNNSEVGVANGVAELDVNGKVPASQLPSFVDDVIEGYYYNSAFYEDAGHTILITGETGKIYIDLDTNKTYRWSGSVYAEISESLALGETSSTAYRGDRGKTAYDHSQDASRITSAVTEGLYKVGGTAQGHISSMTAVQKADLTDLGVADNDDVQAIEEKIDETTTSISGNPISISGLKANQLAVNPIITLEPIQDLHGQSKPYPAGGGKNKYGNGDVSGTRQATVSLLTTLPAGTYVLSAVVTSSDTDNYYSLIYDNTNNTTAGTILRSTGSQRVSTNLTLANACSSLRFYAADSWTTSEGDTFSFKDIQIESGSSATSYAPYENICPISGYDKIEVLSCGKNLFDISKVLIGTVTNGLWTWGGSTSKLFDLKFKANTRYTFSGYQTQSGLNKNVRPRIIYTDGTAENIYTSTSTTRTAFTKTSAEDKTIDYIQAYYGSDSSATVTIENFQIEESTSSTAYSPYHKTTDLSGSLGQTVYGATYYPRTGELSSNYTVMKYIVTGAETTWRALGSGFAVGIDSSSGYGNYSYNSNRAISSCFVKHNAYDWSISDGEFNVADDYICFRSDSNFTTLDAAKSFFATRYANNQPVEVLLYKYSPFTIQLTPHEISLLKDYAYVSTNGTLITLDYHNGEMASLGDVEQLNETVENAVDYMKDYVGANKLKETVNLIPYSSVNNAYTFPCDGYVIANSATASTGTISVNIYDADTSASNIVALMYMRISGTNERQSLFVKKGLRAVVINTIASGAGVDFKALTM